VVGGSIVLLAVACRNKSAPTPGGRPAGSSVASATSASKAVVSGAEFGCRGVSSNTLILGEARPRPETPEEDDQDVELPFAVELGLARAASGQFIVGGLESRHGASFAFAALVDAASGRGKSVELGRVFGEVEPPLFVPYGNGFIGVLADNDASAVVLRLVGLGPPFEASAVRRGAELRGVRRDAPEFSLEVSGKDALAAYSRLEKGQAFIELARVDPEKLTLKGDPFAAPAPLTGEPEAPHLVARPGGYFLAWIARAAAARSKIVPHRDLEPDAGASPSLVDEGPTSVEVASLDLAGAVVGAPRRVTPPSARVVAFEFAATPDGGALLVYRDDREAPGLERTNAEVVLVRPDGSTASRSWETGESAGLPSLLVDAAPAKERPWAWVAVPSERGLGLAKIPADPLALPALVSELPLAGAEALAAAGARLLISRSRASQRELSIVECHDGPPPPPAPPPLPSVE
jgi:hypothetical protein